MNATSTRKKCFSWFHFGLRDILNDKKSFNSLQHADGIRWRSLIFYRVPFAPYMDAGCAVLRTQRFVTKCYIGQLEHILLWEMDSLGVYQFCHKLNFLITFFVEKEQKKLNPLLLFVFSINLLNHAARAQGKTVGHLFTCGRAATETICLLSPVTPRNRKHVTANGNQR